MTKRDDISMEAPKPSDPRQPVSARRRLIRGAFTTPVVLTVCSGSAFAASFSCNPLSNTPQGPAVFGGNTGFRTLQIHKVGTSCFVLVSDANTISIGTVPTSAFPAGTTNTFGGNSYYGFDTSTFAATSATPPAAPVASGTFVVARFNSSGQVNGVGATNSSTNTALSSSCWMSLKA